MRRSMDRPWETADRAVPAAQRARCRASRTLVFLALTVGLVGGGPTALAQEATPAPSPSAIPSASPSAEWPATYPEVLPERIIRRSDRQARGRWRAMSAAPFGSLDGPGVWTGHELLVVSPERQRLAGWNPDRDRWTEYAPPPNRARFGTPAVWTGEELVLVGRRRVTAFSAGSRRWRELPENDLGFRNVIDAIWTGEALVIASQFGKVASYRPGDETWTRLPDVPAPGDTRQLFWTGDRVLATSQEPGWPRVKSSVTGLDLDTGTWGVRRELPLDSNAGPAVWTGDRLVFVSGKPDGEQQHGAYDPAGDSWEPWDVRCKLGGARLAMAGGLLVSEFPRRAIDPVAAACYRLSNDRPRALQGRPVVVTVDDSLVLWSGKRALLERPTRRGLVLKGLRVPSDPG